MERPSLELDESTADPDPRRQLDRWLAEAHADLGAQVAMTLATATPQGLPSARVVLLRAIDDRGLVFYTHYNSRKGRELAINPHAAAVLYWPELDRQVRIEGTVERLAAADSDAYFARRPLGHRVSAIASPQSEVVADRAALARRVEQLLERYRHAHDSVPRPADWGGYRLLPDCYEFWQGRLHRLHDRLRYRTAGDDAWVRDRLAP